MMLVAVGNLSAQSFFAFKFTHNVDVFNINTCHVFAINSNYAVAGTNANLFGRTSGYRCYYHNSIFLQTKLNTYTFKLAK